MRKMSHCLGILVLLGILGCQYEDNKELSFSPYGIETNLKDFSENRCYENVKMIAKGIAQSFSQIEMAIESAIENSRDKREHKVELSVLLSEYEDSEGRAITMILSETMSVKESDLFSLLGSIYPVPYIFIPQGCKKWSNDEPPVIAVTPPCDDEEVEGIIAYSTDGVELILPKESSPEFPVLVITAEPPFEENEDEEEKRDEVKGGPYNTYCHKFILYKFGDPWWDSKPEIYTLLHSYHGSGYSEKRTDFPGVDEKGKTYVFAWPGEYIGYSSTASGFVDLQVWDDDSWWGEPFGRDDLIQHIYGSSIRDLINYQGPTGPAEGWVGSTSGARLYLVIAY
ncbi:MAG: hypothetical protein U9R01_04890 [candidate division WOR-3 bacterium]|nr:hypothetical protein [candidate division WOR-3 bacterium]